MNMKKHDTKQIRILIADDHAVVREGLRTFLSATLDIEVVGEASNGEEAVDLVDRLVPDVVLMDLVMPQLDGITAIQRIHAKHPDVKLIALTSFAGDDTVFPAIRAGAAAYLLKDVGPAELEEAIRATARGEVRVHPQVTQKLMSKVAGAANEAKTLTRREKEVLACLGRGLSNKKIGETLFIAEKTVKTHVSAILAKLGLADRTQAALYAVKNLHIEMDR